jgi:hypothetical protein
MNSVGKTLILIVAVLLISQSVFITIQTYTQADAQKRIAAPTAKASAVGIVSICINGPPTIDLSNCSHSATQNTTYSCWLGADDPDYYTFTYSDHWVKFDRRFASSTEVLFNLTTDGYINFTPNNSDVGNFTINFTVSDGMNCSNSYDSEAFELEVININDPPYLVRDIPNQNLEANETLHAFFLNNYFADPDLDPLNYTVAVANPVFTVTIDPLTSDVVITSTQCDLSTVAIFTAIDPFNATADSNAVTITCLSNEPAPETGEGEGSGGGGGGGSLANCVPEYECYDYFQCRKNNTKIQKCIDKKGCQNEAFLTVPCHYEEKITCLENWTCTDWGPCLPNGTQMRDCAEINKCGTKELIPLFSQDCEYIGTCNDGIKSCHDGSCEEGIDCGGPCAECKSIQVPYPFKEEKGILIYIVTGIILLLLTAVLLYHYFHKEINAALAKAGWAISRKKKKQILLKPEDKKKLLEGIIDLESKIGKLEPHQMLISYSELIRYYLIKACADKIPAEFDLNELSLALGSQKGRIIEVLRKILAASFAKYIKVEQSKELIKRINNMLLLEELRNLVLQTSETGPEDVAREVKEFSVADKASPIDKITIMITNTYIALEFLELEVAKKKYLEILGAYEKLSIKQQEEVFEDISRLFHHINYVNSWFATPIPMMIRYK